MKMEEQHPTITPTISGIMNSRMEDETIMQSGTITTSVVSDVIIVLFSVWLILLSIFTSLLSLV